MAHAASITSPDSGRTWQINLGDNVYQVNTAIPLYRGVWKEGAYTAGDSVTLGGSVWIAMTATSDKPTESSNDWRLAVKRGNDGRDYRPDEERAARPVRFK